MPFWKKTDKGGKKKPPKPAVPRTAQQSIPMQRMFEDGTCRVKPNYYTRTIQYQDINYQLAQQEDKTASASLPSGMALMMFAPSILKCCASSLPRAIMV